MPARSASPELNATVFCVADQCLTTRPPCAAAPPHMERRVAKHPSKSAYEDAQAPFLPHSRESDALHENEQA
eukprot:10016469-Alexandrium_andersonii.AAC.1